jgi:hypothetical protein
MKGDLIMARDNFSPAFFDYLDELLFLGERERYLAHLKRAIEKLKHTLKDNPFGDLEDQVRWPIRPEIASGDGDGAPAISGISVYLQPLVEDQIASGDGDGMPAKALVNFKNELIKIHSHEIERLKADIEKIKNS